MATENTYNIIVTDADLGEFVHQGPLKIQGILLISTGGPASVAAGSDYALTDDNDVTIWRATTPANPFAIYHPMTAYFPQGLKCSEFDDADAQIIIMKAWGWGS